ncbi:MAG: sugar phosphate isomerase/epimerase [Clostridia bacterium]|nr:sugar phosphate isomerase/epimerase [Clostridia bacterium]
MKFGFTTSLGEVEKLRLAKELGYDYAELNFGQLVGTGDEDFERMFDDVVSIGLPTLCCNCFLGGDVNIYSDTAEAKAVNEAWLVKGGERAARLGVKKVVFGSGGKKSVPDGMDRTAAYKMLCDFTAHAGEVLARYGITLVIEPLRSAESNIINTVADGVRLARDCGNPDVKCLGDIYHMVQMGESFDIVPEYAGLLSHCHISRPTANGRTYMSNVNEFDYAGFIAMMKAGGCDTCSIEAGCSDFASEAPAALAVLRQL